MFCIESFTSLVVSGAEFRLSPLTLLHSLWVLDIRLVNQFVDNLFLDKINACICGVINADRLSDPMHHVRISNFGKFDQYGELHLGLTYFHLLQMAFNVSNV